MDDTVSRSSVDSLSTGEEFVVVNAEPRLKIPGNGDINDLEKKMSEVLGDDSLANMAATESASGGQNRVEDVMTKSTSADRIAINLPAHDAIKMNAVKSPTENHQMGHKRTPSNPFSPESEMTVFDNVTYLGSATVNAPRSEREIYRNMAILNEQSQMAIPVMVTVPSTSDGTVRLTDPVTNTEIAMYRIHRILFCARGPGDSNERCCFAFTCSHGESAEVAMFQCHVFRCEIHEAVGKILYSFATAFRRISKSPSSLSESTSSIVEELAFRFDVALEFREDDGKGNFNTCPKDMSVFKLRCDIEKKIVITVQQISNRELKIERCFGLLISPGRNVKHSDMTLIDMDSMGAGSDRRTYIISGHWDPTDPSFQILNTETPKDTRVFLTIAVDLVIEGIQEPVRFLVETKAKIFPANERFWYFKKKQHHEQFLLKLKEVESPEKPNETEYEVVSIESQTEIDRRKAGMSLTLSPTRAPPPQNIQTPNDPEDDSDNDEPLLSGSGVVSKDVMSCDENLLQAWNETITKWHQNLKQRPKQVNHLVRKGIPEALRGEVWQLLAGCHESQDLLEAYRVLITKDSPCEQVIMRDINRTFPAHDYFRETGGAGQESLFKISKAYSVYDEEVGYCQGASFLAAALLLHMPEEQAFCVLVKIMFDYHLRDLFKGGMEELHLKFYQLERLMQDQLPDLFNHFMDMGLEAHMFASQWFLTLFTAKFPLFMVYHILDIVLGEGLDQIFNVALALLKTSRKELLALDFEGVLKFFRVHLPKKYRSEENANELINAAISLKVSHKKLRKYEKEYITMKEQEQEQEDPIERWERENKRLLESNMRLEQENDDLAHELVTSKIYLRNELDNTEDKADALGKELLSTKGLLVEVEEEKKRLEVEASQLKEMCRREMDKSETENSRNAAIIADYKQICSQLSERLEKQQTSYREELGRIKAQIQSCESCSRLVSPDGQFKKIDLPSLPPSEINPMLVDRDRQIRELELELAQTKLALVESECKTQDLTHQMNAALTELQASKNTWFQKTLTSIREVTNKKESTKENNKDIKE